MRNTLLVFIFINTVLISCGQEHTSTPVLEQKDIETPNNADSAEIQQRITMSNDKYIDTKDVYVDADDKQIFIENSFPKGGLKYVAPNGKEYVYAVFWTRITNETDNPFELTMDFPESSYELTSSQGRFFKLFIPADTITLEKVSLFNYGLDLEEYLDNNFHKTAELIRSINPKNTSGFYVVTLFNKGVDGTVRTGLRIDEQKLIYRINDKEIHCGKTNLKMLKQNEWNCQEVHRNYMDSLMLDVCSTKDLEFIDLYPVLDSIASNQHENLVLVDALKSKGFKVTNWGRGNWMEGPRMVSFTMSNHQCECQLEKLYYSTEQKGKYRVTERIKCKEASGTDKE